MNKVFINFTDQGILNCAAFPRTPMKDALFPQPTSYINGRSPCCLHKFPVNIIRQRSLATPAPNSQATLGSETGKKPFVYTWALPHQTLYKHKILPGVFHNELWFKYAGVKDTLSVTLVQAQTSTSNQNNTDSILPCSKPTLCCTCKLECAKLSEYILLTALTPLSVHCHIHVMHSLLSLFLLVRDFK